MNEIPLQSAYILSSNLDLKSAASEFFTFLKKYFPIKTIFFAMNEESHGRIFVLAYADDTGTQILCKYLEYSKEQLEVLEKVKNISEMFIETEDDPLASPYKNEELSFFFPCLVHRVRNTSLKYGSASYCFEPNTKLTEADLQQLALLKMPLHVFVNTHYRIWELEQLNKNISQDNIRLRKKVLGFDNIELIGSSGGLKNITEKLKQVAPLDIPVLLHGATGTGKELIARVAHQLSSRSQHPFIAVNCGAITPSLIDSELFGYNKGAFTGALNEHKGFFEQADKGTLFLDEVAELPLDAQVRLLRTLQEHTVQRIGATHITKTDFRLITATHKNLQEMVAEGKFREDLYYRLSTITLTIPSLNERKQDIPLLLNHFIEIHASRFSMLSPQIPQEEITKLMQHNWQGNVRELENVVLEALALSTVGKFQFWPNTLQNQKITFIPSIQENTQTEFLNYDTLVKQHILQALEISKGKVHGKNSASELLGLNSSTLRKKLQKYNISFDKKLIH